MTSISGIGSLASASPFMRVQKLLTKQVSAGKISSTDQTALNSAISDISTALTPGATTQTGSMKDQVANAIDNEVSSGKLSSDQATELKGLFAKAHGHMHHVQAFSDTTALSNLFSTDSTGSTTSTSGTTAASGTASDGITSVATGAHGLIDGLAHFVNGVRTAIQKNGLYGAAGGPAGVVGSLLVNKLA